LATQQIGTRTIAEDEWIMLTVTRAGSNVSAYINGTIEHSVTMGVTSQATGSPASYVGRATSNSNWTGLIDEVGIWTRTLTANDVNDLYNNGTGLLFVDTSQNVTVSLNAPADASSNSELSRTFNATLTPTNISLTNATLWIYNTTSLVNNTIVNIVTGTVANDTLFTLSSLEVDTFTWNVFGCGVNDSSSTTCNFASSNFTFTRTAFSNEGEAFSVNSFETDSETFRLNITTISSVLSVSANLRYNGTISPGTTSCNSSGFCQILSTIDIPLVDGSLEDQNKSFFWEIIVFDGTDNILANTTSQFQNASRIHLEQCDATFTARSLNFSAIDESDLSRINPFTFDGDFESWLGGGNVRRPISFSNSSVTEFGICLDPTDRNFTIDATIEYNDFINSSTYDTRNYFFQLDTINTTLQQIPLFLLSRDDATSFILKVQDTNLLPVVDALIEIQRFNPGTGNFSIVQIAKTDDNGQTVGFFKTETVDYRFIIRKNGVILLQTSQQKVVPETAPFTLTFTVGADLGAPWTRFEDLGNLTKTLIFNESTTNVTFAYIDSSGIFTSGRLLLVRKNLTGADETICDINSTLTSATLICPTGNITQTYVATAFITRTSGIFLVDQIIFTISTFASVAGLLGVFLAWFIILVSAFAFKFNEIAGIVLMNLTVIFVNIIGMVNFGFLFIFGMMGVSIMIIVLLKK